MNIIKGDTVYLRSGKDVANMKKTRLEEALRIDDAEAFQKKRAEMPMAEQIAAANKIPGVRGEVIRVFPKENKVLVRGLNMVTKHQKPRASSGAGAVQQGGRIQVEAPIPVSRVMLVCDKCQSPTRVSIELRQEARGDRMKTVRVRICKKCKREILLPDNAPKR